MQLAENDGQNRVDTRLAATGEKADSETLNAETKGAATGETIDDEGVIVTIGEESPPSDEEENRAPAPEWVKELRKSDREKTRRIRELEDKLTASQPGKQAAAEMAKPTLADCEYDEDAYDAKLLAWQEQQAQARTQQQQKADAQKKEQETWQAKLTAHGTAKAALKVDDYDDAEAAVAEKFSQTQRAIIVSGADNSALVEYALGKNPAKLKELASITDPVKFAFAIARLESQLKVTPRKAAPPPERSVRGNAAAAGAVDTKLASLEAEADRTGDRSKVIAYRREQRRKQA